MLPRRHQEGGINLGMKELRPQSASGDVGIFVPEHVTERCTVMTTVFKGGDCGTFHAFSHQPHSIDPEIFESIPPKNKVFEPGFAMQLVFQKYAISGC